MAYVHTFEFYLAIILGIIAILIIIAFVFLLLNPPKDKFDRVGVVGGKKKANLVGKTPPKPLVGRKK